MCSRTSVRRAAYVLALLAIAFHAPLNVQAQSGAGSISGSVTDPTGAVVPDTLVTVTNTATNVAMKVNTNAAGDFTAPNLPVGQYNVRAEKGGFKPTVLSNVTLNA